MSSLINSLSYANDMLIKYILCILNNNILKTILFARDILLVRDTWVTVLQR